MTESSEVIQLRTSRVLYSIQIGVMISREDYEFILDQGFDISEVEAE